MRLGIRPGWKANAPFRLYVEDSEIQVRRPVQQAQFESYELCWLWCDGTDYTLLHPPCGVGTKMQWNILKRSQTICTGRMLHPSLQNALLHAALPYIEWTYDRELVLDEPKCCGGALRLADGRRLAVWRQRKWVDVAVRNRLPGAVVPLICAMIMARMYDPTG